MKKIVVRFIYFYQKHAPKRMREACRFIPTCSDYMLLAIEKYGLFRGVIKGICRICRCHPPNGGVDYP